MKRPSSKILAIGSLVIVLIVIGVYNFLPSLWISIFYPIRDYPIGMSKWKIARQGLKERKIPTGMAERLSDPWKDGSKNPQDWTFRRWVRIVSDFQVSEWHTFIEQNLMSTENLSKAIGPFPNKSFGTAGTITKEAPNMPEKLGVPNSVTFECRFIALRNPNPFRKSENAKTGTYYYSDQVRAICPCGNLEGRWTLSEQVGVVNSKGDLLPRDGMYREACLHIDPLILLNLPPQWISEFGSSEKWLDYMEAHLSSELPGPSWPIYVEQNGLLRQATKSDMTFVSKGTFKIP